MTARIAMVLGAAGAVGRAFTAALRGAGLAVVTVDRSAAVDAAPAGADDVAVHDDVCCPGEATRSHAARADWVLACLPEDAILAAIDQLVPVLRPGALFVDTSSVKSRVAARMATARRDVELLSINPLFAPSVGFAGQRVAAIGEPGAEAAALLELLDHLGCRAVAMTAEQHDRTMAAVQVATHAAVLAFGAAVSALGITAADLLVAATPPFCTLLALLARISGGTPEVYWEIQHGNERAPVARAALEAGLAELSAVVALGDRAGFDRLLDRSRALLGDRLPAMQQLCARLFAVPPVPDE
ncbi:MAG TPA: prephenate dehydrogenase/arogenate dehydrogenase family protein [Kofleriaceae bacterium]|jgi:prephenate dehydrogenase|nr:prephenate dehydrogenase/arogenate dehydrogenase family protein [Kofleriaceae bacterium]